MVEETIFQNWIFTKFILPVLLIFTLVFAVLEKTKLFGDDKKQLNAIVALVISLIFVGFVFPKEVVTNMILFMTVALVVMFVVLILWGFVYADVKTGFAPEKWMKWSFAIVIIIAVVLAVIWSTGDQFGILNYLTKQPSTKMFWSNVIFIAAVIGALVAVIKSGKKT